MKLINGIRKKRTMTAFLALIICANPFLCAGWTNWFSKPVVIMDPTERVIYQSADAKDIINDFQKDKNKAEEKYDNNRNVIYGVVSSKNITNKIIYISGSKDDKDSIACETMNDDNSETIKNLSVGDRVKVFGNIFSDFLGSGVNVYIDSIVKIEKNAPTPADTIYSFKNGSFEDRTRMKKRKIEGSDFSFYIPHEMEAVEHDIAREGLGTLNGYQYRLNELDKKANAEQLFVCYFDKETMVGPNDRKDNKAIEEAMIRDIWKKDDIEKFPLTTRKAYYGKEYTYYQDTFEKDLGIDVYQTELAFTEEENGIILFLYIYKDKPLNINDVMLTMRFAGEK